jgi:hypothetical protein
MSVKQVWSVTLVEEHKECVTEQCTLQEHYQDLGQNEEEIQAYYTMKILTFFFARAS